MLATPIHDSKVWRGYPHHKVKDYELFVYTYL